MSTLAYIGLGANLGNARQTIAAAIDMLGHSSGVLTLKQAPLYSSDPVDAQGPIFINTVVAIDTTLEPLSLLDLLQAIEQQHGRERPYRNAPRTLDLDLLLYGTQTIDTPRLSVPHPRMHQRAFVLRPLQDLTPDLQLVQGNFTTLLAGCQEQKLDRLVN
ncbi:MAG: 2-amino-4-hydroxy-6-hydroxymethyldihydropteridine diphosphokinase [Alcaligenaceae bacterium]|nr:2-amino-4-hydroxy-6-hydroxymethyldihydropteridine diphosphokinase [Alcaligenaceae bacterium]